MDVKQIKWIYHLRGDYRMAQDITTKFEIARTVVGDKHRLNIMFGDK